MVMEAVTAAVGTGATEVAVREGTVAGTVAGTVVTAREARLVGAAMGDLAAAGMAASREPGYEVVETGAWLAVVGSAAAERAAVRGGRRMLAAEMAAVRARGAVLGGEVADWGEAGVAASAAGAMGVVEMGAVAVEVRRAMAAVVTVAAAAGAATVAAAVRQAAGVAAKAAAARAVERAAAAAAAAWAAARVMSRRRGCRLWRQTES